MKKKKNCEPYFIIKTKEAEFRYRIFPEDIKIAKRMIRGRTRSFLDYFSFLIEVFDKQPVQNVPKEWGELYEWQIVGVNEISEESRFTLSTPTFVKYYLKSRGIKFPEVTPGDENRDALFQGIIDKQKAKMGEERYEKEYGKLAKLIG